LISFEIAGQDFCIDIRGVREIRGWSPVMPVPETPDYVLGVVNLRGVVIPVIDLRSRLGLGQTEPSSRHVILVVEDGDRVAGLLVDGVQETFKVAPSLLQEPPVMGRSGEPPFVDAMLPMEGRMLSRLVVGAFFPEKADEIKARKRG
jgi:purine-binding chemotaxis protein CheW